MRDVCGMYAGRMRDISGFKVPHTIFHVPHTSRIPVYMSYIFFLHFYMRDVCGMYAGCMRDVCGTFRDVCGTFRDVCGMYAGCMRDVCEMYDVFENYIINPNKTPSIQRFLLFYYIQKLYTGFLFIDGYHTHFIFLC